MEKCFGEYNPKIEYRERLGCYAVIINEKWQGCVVKTPGGYFLPGGGIESGEDDEQCLRRECIEEIGYDITLNDYIGEAAVYTETRKKNDYLKAVGRFYLSTLKESNEGQVDEDHEMVWLNIGDCIRELFLKNQSWAVGEGVKVLKNKSKNSGSNYLDAEGRIKVWPSKNSEKIKMLEYMSTKFEKEVEYSEKEVNEIINKWHTFNDLFILRRGMVDYKFIKRTRRGDKYWRD